jgi:hypothetical protein
MLAGHPAVFTFPESHYFQKIAGRFRQSPMGLIVSPRAAALTLDRLGELLNAERPSVPHWWIGTKRYALAFTQMADESAQRAGRRLWIEKSPVHLHYMDVISRFVAGARFLHILRDGRDVVASLVEACRRDPERWVRQLVRREPVPDQRTLYSAAVGRWNHDLQLSLARIGDRNHLLVFYDDLIADTANTLSRVCSFIQVDYDPQMEQHWISAEAVIGWRASMPHMERVFHPVEDRRGLLFRQIFSKKEQEDIAASLRFGGDISAINRPRT